VNRVTSGTGGVGVFFRRSSFHRSSHLQSLRLPVESVNLTGSSSMSTSTSSSTTTAPNA
jgi:hypothetical protein